VTDTNVIKLSQPGTFTDSLTEILRNEAHALLTQAVEMEVADQLPKIINHEPKSQLARANSNCPWQLYAQALPFMRSVGGSWKAVGIVLRPRVSMSRFGAYYCVRGLERATFDY
jgi:hypothetical protein